MKFPNIFKKSKKGYMRNGNKWLLFISFLFGCLVSYITLQFSLFLVNLEINVVETLFSIGTILIGIYIAHTIQKNINKGQNQYSYIGGKLDSLWMEFINFSKNISYSSNVEISTITSYFKDASPDIDFLKSVFESFGIKPDCIQNLENKMEEFEEYLTNLPSIDNVIQTDNIKTEINSKILEINICFKNILRIISEL